MDALRAVYGVDTQLIADGTYFVVETAQAIQIAGCGGWSKRARYTEATLSSARRFAARSACDAARIRAFFVHPDWARRGIGAMILEACESAATAAGFTRLEMGATLTGVPFYRAKGYRAVEDLAVALPDGDGLAIVRMEKDVEQKPSSGRNH